MKDGTREDRRIGRTRQVLHEALMSLVREKSFDDIVVKEILDRANVGRSTFYMHFRDKEDLLGSAIRELLGPIAFTRAGKPPERLLSFSMQVLEHVDRHRRISQMGAKGRAILHAHLQEVLTGVVARGLGKELQGRRKSGPIPPDLLTRHVAATFVLVLNWWVEEAEGLTAGEVDRLFRQLIEPVLMGVG